MILLLAGICHNLPAQTTADKLNGAWEAINEDNSRSVAIIADGYFAIANYTDEKFVSTVGGYFNVEGNEIVATIEFDTGDSAPVGTVRRAPLPEISDKLNIHGATWKRIDDGTPGELNGAWLFAGRENNGQITRREPGARKTMKILSGTRFQWIAYNSETGAFSGTGGGTYTTSNGKYTENIEFFPRDPSRVGVSLVFDFDVQENEWHHKGKNSRGEYMYEVWRAREELLVSK